MRIAIAQINPTPGDLPGNAARILAAAGRAQAAGADLLVVPELALLGYPPRDLLLRPSFQRAVLEANGALAREFASRPALILGTALPNPHPVGKPLLNAAVLMRDGRIEGRYAKRLLPTYDVFDETRYFAPGEAAQVFEHAGCRIGVLVCEDLWRSEILQGRLRYAADPVGDLAALRPEVVVAISASPYHAGKDAHRRDLFAAEARRLGVPVLTVNQVGGNDEILFDGRSRLFDPTGRVRLRLAAFGEEEAVVDMDRLPAPIPDEPLPAADELRQALVLGLRDYCRKTRLPSVVLGLSGGVDSAVAACVAVEALGPSAVLGVSLPGPFTRQISREDAHELARRLGISWHEISITTAYESMRAALEPVFGEAPFDVTEENLQARIRGALLMAVSNKHGHLLLSTGNKSEIAVGYCTLYGDMNGGLAILSDVWKTGIYQLAEHYAGRGWIPRRVIERPPSAELRPDQEDADTLPPYEVLDRILGPVIEEGAGREEMLARGEDPAVVDSLLRRVERNEYKRRQLAPGLKVSPIAFGVGWRMPLAAPAGWLSPGVAAVRDPRDVPSPRPEGRRGSTRNAEFPATGGGPIRDTPGART